MIFIKPYTHPNGLMLMDPHPSQQHAGLQHAVWQLQQEVTKSKARFKPTSKSFDFHFDCDTWSINNDSTLAFQPNHWTVETTYCKKINHTYITITTSVTRLGALLHFCNDCNDSKPLATSNLSKSSTILGNFCKDIKTIHFSSEIIFGQLL